MFSLLLQNFLKKKVTICFIENCSAFKLLKHSHLGFPNSKSMMGPRRLFLRLKLKFKLAF